MTNNKLQSTCKPALGKQIMKENSSTQRRIAEELGADGPVFWHPGHFLDSLVQVTKPKKKRDGRRKKKTPARKRTGGRQG